MNRVLRKSSPWFSEVRSITSLALPIIGGMASQMLMGLADTIMVGRVGVLPLAAASFVNTITTLPFVFCLGLLSSLSVLTAQAYGEGKGQRAGELLRHGLSLSVGLGILTCIAMALLMPCLHWFGQPEEVVVASKTYLILFSLSIIPALVSQSAKQVAEALCQPWIPTVILLGGVLVNVFLNWILIFGNMGAPALDLEGAGWATLLARSFMAACMFLFVIRADQMKPFRPARWRSPLQVQCFKQLLNIGLPVGAQQVLEIGALGLAALMMGWISADAMAAHQIALNCATASYMAAFGIGSAVCIRVGQAWGAGELIRTRQIGMLGLAMAAMTMSVFAVVFMLAGERIASVFVEDRQVIVLVSQLLFVAAAFQIADGVQVAAISALRGLSDVRVPALIGVLAYWLIRVPLAYVLGFPLGMGAVGIWIGLAAGLVAAAFCLSWRFHLKSQFHVQKHSRMFYPIDPAIR